jgi:hypothetical protein
VRNVTHELIGISAAIGAARAARLGPAATSAAVAAAFYVSWLPDVDQLGSRVHRRSRLERRSLVAGAVGALLRLPLVALGDTQPEPIGNETAHDECAGRLAHASLGADHRPTG